MSLRCVQLQLLDVNSLELFPIKWRKMIFAHHGLIFFLLALKCIDPSSSVRSKVRGRRNALFIPIIYDTAMDEVVQSS